MAERPPITGIGRICGVRTPRRVYNVRMENGYVAVAVVKKKGPPVPEEFSDEAIAANEMKVTVEFTPFDMSRSKISEWHLD